MRVESPGRQVVAFDVTYEQGGLACATCRSTYLAWKEKDAPRGPAAPAPLPPDETWELPANEGRRYAALSGDYNPVHLWPLSARLFGYARPLLHGMDAVGRALAAIERGHGRPVATLAAEFRKPILLPATVQLAWASEPGHFQVTSGEAIHVVGHYG
jgi:hypothetical protein